MGPTLTSVTYDSTQASTRVFSEPPQFRTPQHLSKKIGLTRDRPQLSEMEDKDLVFQLRHANQDNSGKSASIDFLQQEMMNAKQKQKKLSKAIQNFNLTPMQKRSGPKAGINELAAVEKHFKKSS